MSRKKLYHPVCHLIHGERLYFIIVSFKYEAITSAEMLIDKLDEFNLSESSCAHLIFGDMDTIIRVWANDNKISQFIQYISSLKNVRKYRLLLAENMTPWYIYSINQKLKNKKYNPAFTTEKIDKLLIGDISSEYYYNYNETKEISSMYKFWLLIEEQFPNNSLLYERLSSFVRKMRYKKNRDEYEVDNLSLYSYLTSSHRGVIIKANSSNFIESCSKLSELVNSYGRNSEIRITTYVARSPLKENTDSILLQHVEERPIDNRKGDILYNLFMSHDCNKRIYPDNSEEHNLIEAFTTVLEPIFYKIFSYDKDWCFKVRQARNAMKWIVEKKNSTLTSVLLKEYASLERKLRALLNNIFIDNKYIIKDIPRIRKRLVKQLSITDEQVDIILDIIDKKFIAQKMTFGDVPALLNILMKTCPVSSPHCHVLQNFSQIVFDLSKQRNLLAHGTETKLFKLNTSSKKWLWEDFAFTYFQYHFFSPNWQQNLKKAIEVYENTKKNKKAEQSH